MFYRENGQFKSTYASDQQMLPILQDRVFMFALVVFAFGAVPFLVSDYLFLSLVIPFLGSILPVHVRGTLRNPEVTVRPFGSTPKAPDTAQPKPAGDVDDLPGGRW